MVKKFIPAVCFMTIGLFLLGDAGMVGWSQPANREKNNQSATIVQVGDYILTVKDLEQIINTYPAGTVSSREAKRNLVESLITTKLFSWAARDANLDKTEDFPKAKEKAHRSVLIHAYFERYVRPKFSEEEARKFFVAHKEEYKDFTYARTQIRERLKDEALTAVNQSLKQQFGVRQRDDLLKDLDLNRLKDPSLVLAEVGSTTVTAGDLKQSEPQLAEMTTVPFETKKYLLDALVLEQLYVLAAEQAGLANDPAVQKAFAWSVDQLLAGRYTHLIESKVTPEEARKYYEAQPEEFRYSDQLRLRQIVVKTVEEARAAKAKLDQGESFEQIAKSSSIDQASASKSGDIGWVRKGALHPEIERVAFQLKPNQVSEPIKSSDGYYIIRLEERIEGKLRPFNEVMPNLVMKLQMRAVETERRRLMNVYKVTINDRLL